MGVATTLTTPQSQVDALILQVATENDLEMTGELLDLQPGGATLESVASASKPKSAAETEAAKEDGLMRR